MYLYYYKTHLKSSLNTSNGKLYTHVYTACKQILCLYELDTTVSTINASSMGSKRNG